MLLRDTVGMNSSPTPSPDDAAPGDEQARLSVVDVPDANRFELRLDGVRVGLADYSLRDDVLTIPHVETDPQHRGKNFAARLMKGVLDDVRERKLTVRPLCPYAGAYMERHPDTLDLVER